MEKTLASMREDSATKDQELEVLKVHLDELKHSVEILHKMHQNSQDQNFLGMMDHIFE